MKKILLIILLLASSLLLITCEDDGLDGLSYGNCKTGDRRCSGSKLEVCTDYHEWTMIADCAEGGAECIYEKNDYYCSEEFEQTPDTIVEWEDEEEEPDDGGSQMLDNFGSTSDDDPDENDIEDNQDDSDDSDQSDLSDESEVSDEITDDDSDTDEDELDEDTDDSDTVPVCGNGVVEGDEICEKNDVKDCTDIDPVKYSAGKAICDETCMDFNTITCVE